MPKRKTSDDEEDTFPSESSDADSQPSGSTTEHKATSKKQSPKSAASHVNKKSKTDDNSSSSGATNRKVGGSVKIHSNADGDKYIDLGKKRRAVVRSFKGMPLVDIREYYSADGQEKPGKKGISLTFEQWEILRDSVNAIDELFAEKKA